MNGRSLFAKRCGPVASQLFMESKRKLSHGIKVAVMGACGETGQPLCLLLKQSPWYQEVALFDISPTKGLAMELNHIDTPCLATAHEGPNGLQGALKDANIVAIVAASEEDELNANGKIVAALSKACSKYCPQAFVCVASSPVNSLLPAAVEAFKRSGQKTVDKARMFGVTSLDSVRASTLLAEVVQVAPDLVEVPVVGGSSPNTVVPLLTSAKPSVELSTEEAVKVTRAVQEADAEVKEAKGSGRSSLSAAFAINRFLSSLSKALLGHPGVTESAFVASSLLPQVSYMTSQVELGPGGVTRVLGIPELSDYECCLLETALPHLKRDIEAGEKLVSKIPT